MKFDILYRIPRPSKYYKNLFKTNADLWVTLIASTGIAVCSILMGFRILDPLLGTSITGSLALSILFYVIGQHEISVDDEDLIRVERSRFFLTTSHWLSGWYIVKSLFITLFYLVLILFIVLADLFILVFYWKRMRFEDEEPIEEKV